MQALDAKQGALDATSNNIANVNTPRIYPRSRAARENPETDAGGEITGGGVTLSGLQSIRDELLNLQIQQQTSAQKSADTQSSTLAQIQTYFSTAPAEISPAP